MEVDGRYKRVWHILYKVIVENDKMQVLEVWRRIERYWRRSRERATFL